MSHLSLRKVCGDSPFFFSPEKSQLNFPVAWTFPLLLVGFWFTLYSRMTFSPVIVGTDSTLRLFFIDRLIVAESWMPGLQFLLQVVSFISDTAIAYKILCTAIGCTAMTLLFEIIRRNLGLLPMLFSSIFFFIHRHWVTGMSSPYLEASMFLMMCAWWVAFKSGRTVLWCTFLAMACFTRHEALLAAPIVLAIVWYQQRKWAPVILASIMYLPSTSYNLWLMLARPSRLLSAPSVSGLYQAKAVLTELTTAFFVDPRIQVVGVLALMTIVTTLIYPPKNGFGRKQLLMFLGCWGTFLAFFILVPALIHHFEGSHRFRKEYYTVIPTFVLASIFLGRICLIRPKYGLPFALAIFFVSVFTFGNYNKVYHSQQARAEDLSRRLSKRWNRQTDVVSFCPLQARSRVVNFDRWYRTILYTRFAGWKTQVVNCQGLPGTELEAERAKGPLVYFFHDTATERKRYSHFLADCEYISGIGNIPGLSMASLCAARV